MKRLLMVLLLSLYPSAAHSVTIHFDPGGNVARYYDHFRTLQNHNVPVRIDGQCISACTFVFLLPRDQVCVTKTAWFGFHQASWIVTGEPALGITAWMTSFYPPVVHRWIKAQGGLTQKIIYMRAAELNGYFRRCK